MKVMGVGELKNQFAAVLKRVRAGEEIDIAYGKNKEVIARLVPRTADKQSKRKIGILKKKSKVVFSKDFRLTTDEFLGLPK
jgi:antitoxin (DNA-binding transcriptional repressor) of toxin-antitoxin stability system